MKRILVLHTGGTIAMQEDSLTKKVAPGASNPLLSAPITVPADVELVVEDIFNLPSPHITPQEMLQLKERIQLAKLAGFAGIVITHGTDTLEETAFFLDTTIGNLMPIVITGAMRSSNELGSDGLYNFESAIRVARRHLPHPDLGTDWFGVKKTDSLFARITGDTSPGRGPNARFSADY